MKTFLNLTNGLEVAGLIQHDGVVRIQSTHCEQKLWSRIIEDLDYSFLLPVVSGEEVTVVDLSHRQDGVSRAIYQGLPWIRFALEVGVLGSCVDSVSVVVHGHECNGYFYDQYRGLSSAAKAKLRYLRKFRRPGHGINLVGLSTHTERDGDYTYLVERYHYANGRFTELREMERRCETSNFSCTERFVAAAATTPY